MEQKGRLVLPPFSVRNSTGQDWERWCQTLEFYFVSENIKDAKVKQAKLLLLGGPEIQDVYYALPLVTQYPEGEDAYTHTKSQLTSKIVPSSNKWYERNVLSTMRQSKGESIATFITRIRKQVKLCKFQDALVDEAIQGQLINGCSSADIRTELMKMKESATLKEFETLARTLETVSSQSSAMSNSTSTPVSNSTNDNSSLSTADSVSRVQDKGKRHSKFDKNKKQASKPASSFTSDKITCFCCGNEGHKAKDPKCPAQSAKCSKCKKVGHYSKVCQQGKKTTFPTEKTVKAVLDDDYVFCVLSQSSDTADELISCRVGDKPLVMFIDSGTKYSMASLNTWRRLLKSHARHDGFVQNPSINFYDATGTLKYHVRHTVRIEIECNERKIQTELVIVEENIQTLLGRRDAKDLGVLRVGLRACASDTNIQTVQCEVKPHAKLKDFQLRIPIDDSVTPVIQPFRRVPYSIKERVENEIKKLLALDIIERVDGPSRWVSPIVPTPRGEDKLRICVDMRRANEAVLRENYPIPTMEDTMPVLQGATVFSKIDLNLAYHQIELHPASREITTFGTHVGMYRYKRLMFGIKCAPEMFQRILENILTTLNGVVNYQDDILVFGRTMSEHDENLEALLKRLQDVGLGINPDKCEFRKKEVRFLGHIISENSIRPMFDKVQAIREFRSPATAEELRRFLGMVTYLGKFIPNLSTELSDLQKTARVVPFQWKKTDEKSFIRVKGLLSEETHLGIFDPDLKPIVMADASPVGLGAVLLQEKGDDVRVICYTSRSLSTVERRYSQTEKEALALVFAVERLRIYLLGREFDLVTDHKPLQTVFSPASKPCARLERWLLRLQGFNYRVRYAPGKNNLADPLSRLLQVKDDVVTMNDIYEKNLVMFTNHLAPAAVTLREIRMESAKDPEIAKICETLNAGQEVKDKPYSLLSQELCVVTNVLLRGTRIVVPASLRARVLANAHEGHPGICKIKDRLRTKVWWPGIDRQAEQIVRSCDACQKVGKTIIKEQMTRRELPDGPWQDLAIDFKHLPSGHQLCVLVDYFSKYVEASVLCSTTAEETIEFLDDCFARHGIPYSLTSDNGPPFNSHAFAEYLKTLGITHFTTIPYWARANGEVERQNRSLQKIVKIAQLQKSNWKKEMNDYLLMYRSTPHSVTRKTPAELLFNRKLRDKLPSLKERVEEQEVRDADAVVKTRSLTYDQKAVPTKDLAVGDTVMIAKPFTKKKSEPRFEEDLGTVEAINGAAVTVATPTKDVIKHKNQIEKYQSPEASRPIEEISSQPSEPTLRRSARTIQPPGWWKDFEVPSAKKPN